MKTIISIILMAVSLSATADVGPITATIYGNPGQCMQMTVTMNSSNFITGTMEICPGYASQASQATKATTLYLSSVSGYYVPSINSVFLTSYGTFEFNSDTAVRGGSVLSMSLDLAKNTGVLFTSIDIAKKGEVFSAPTKLITTNLTFTLK